MNQADKFKFNFFLQFQTCSYREIFMAIFKTDSGTYGQFWVAFNWL